MCEGTPKETLVAELQMTASEITRYRDREWLNLVTFTGAIFVVLGFAVAQQDPTRHYWWFVDACFLTLTAANIYYTSYAHMRLADERLRLRGIRKLLGTDQGLQQDVEPFGSTRYRSTGDWRKEWWKGFWDHLVPFFMFDVVLAIMGIAYVHQA